MTPIHTFTWTAWVTLAALVMYCWTVYNVGRARGRLGIKAPLMDGPPEFSNMVRVHANTVEQMVLFLPALWLCALLRGDHIAAIGGTVWVIGRVVYALGYYRDPAKRGPGFAISLLASAGLMLAAAGSLLGL